jgi:hypothetical protein
MQVAAHSEAITYRTTCIRQQKRPVNGGQMSVAVTHHVPLIIALAASMHKGRAGCEMVSVCVCICGYTKVEFAQVCFCVQQASRPSSGLPPPPAAHNNSPGCQPARRPGLPPHCQANAVKQ